MAKYLQCGETLHNTRGTWSVCDRNKMTICPFSVYSTSVSLTHLDLSICLSQSLCVLTWLLMWCLISALLFIAVQSLWRRGLQVPSARPVVFFWKPVKSDLFLCKCCVTEQRSRLIAVVYWEVNAENHGWRAPSTADGCGLNSPPAVIRSWGTAGISNVMWHI